MPYKILTFLAFILQLQAATAQYKTELYVALDGSGDFTSIQEAIDNAKAFPYERITIHIKNGVYREKVKVHACHPKIAYFRFNGVWFGGLYDGILELVVSHGDGIGRGLFPFRQRPI